MFFIIHPLRQKPIFRCLSLKLTCKLCYINYTDRLAMNELHSLTPLAVGFLQDILILFTIINVTSQLSKCQTQSKLVTMEML